VSSRGGRSGAGKPLTREFALTEEFFDDLEYWIGQDARIARRLLRLMRMTLRDPFHGLGKPEPLKGTEGYWSRRLTDEHRFVYRVTPTALICVKARFHY
jgi:toxin YoeB